MIEKNFNKDVKKIVLDQAKLANKAKLDATVASYFVLLSISNLLQSSRSVLK